MAYGFRDDDLFEINMSLRCKVKNQERIISEFESGERYIKLQNDYKKVINGYIKEISRLKHELGKAHAQAVSVRKIWTDECDMVWHEHTVEIAKKNEEIRRLEEKIWDIQKKADEDLAAIVKKYTDMVNEKECIIIELKNKLAHAEALLGRDSTNTSIPTGQTPPYKDRHIPNSRRSTGKQKGGQPGHERHVLEKPAEADITGIVDHMLDEGDICPVCDSDDLIYTGEYEEKYEIDVEVKVNKILHKIWLYECAECGQIIRCGIDPGIRADCQYGPNVQAIALSLMNTSNSAINKVPVHLSGITNGEISPCDGYIAKLMPRAASRLEGFMGELFKKLISLKLIYWDDTVVFADKKRICLRFYGNEEIAYYVAHDKKDMDSVIEDGVLEALTPEASVMHDHNSINYNERFAFRNIECNAHVQRDLQKIIDETGHKEPGEIKELITETINDRKAIIEKGGSGFDEGYIAEFGKKLSDILSRAEEAASKNTSMYSGQFERAVIKRIQEYRDNYFAWIRDFSLPTTNNLSERSLRPVKTKMKVSGQFASSKTANNYARVRTYIETCRRNGINEITALSRLCAGNPYTVEEILST